MGKWLLLLGIVLMAFAMVVLFVSLSNAPQTIAISQALVCEPGETYSEALGRSVYSGTESMGREFFAYCQGDGDRREVTPQAFLVKAGMFAVPFLAGLFLFMIGIFRMTWRVTRSAISHVAANAVVTRSGQPVSRVIINDKEVDQLLKGMFGQSVQPQNRGNLTERLRQLQEAYDARLISKDEYDHVRQQILDSLDD